MSHRGQSSGGILDGQPHYARMLSEHRIRTGTARPADVRSAQSEAGMRGGQANAARLSSHLEPRAAE